MKKSTHIKTILFFLISFLLGVQNTYAKTKLNVGQNGVVKQANIEIYKNAQGVLGYRLIDVETVFSNLLNKFHDYNSLKQWINTFDATRFFGPGEQINLYPQSANLNQGAWKQMENSWAADMVAGKDVKIQVEAVFSGTSQRPTSFQVKYTIDGQPFQENFINQ